MSIALVALAVLAVRFLLRARPKKGRPEVERESTPALDAWIAEALEVELAEGALGLRASTPEERRKLGQSLRGEPDPDVVGAIEEKVDAVELEYVKYAHEADAEVTLRVRYGNANAGTASKRVPWKDVPVAVQTDFAARGGTRVFRTWVFPWARAHAL